jgi:hypothetical protein
MKNQEQLNKNIFAEEGQTISPAEMEEAEREMHMNGRAVRVDETLEQYRKEREESWQKRLEQQKAKDQEELKKARQSVGLESVGDQDEKKNKYEGFADKISIDEKKPPKPEQFFPPAAGNMFGENDEPTLAGKVIAKDVYDRLVERQDHKPSFSAQEIIQLGKEALEDFKKSIQDYGRFSFDVSRPGGKTGFHLNGEDGRVSRDHLFYFSKSTKEWKNPKETQTRAYLTMDSSEVKNIQKHFIDICSKLYEAGVDFTGKAASPNGLERRTDNAVFYIADSDKEKAGKIIREFLQERGIGHGNVEAAEADPEQNGLSWAPEPNEKDVELWQKVSGSSEKASYNTVVASKVVPHFLRRLAESNLKVGDKKSADIFTKEADRVSKLIEEGE